MVSSVLQLTKNSIFKAPFILEIYIIYDVHKEWPGLAKF